MSKFEHHSISNHFVKAVINASQRLEIDTSDLLTRAGISPAMLENDQFRVTPEQFSDLMRLSWEMGDDEWIGMGSQPSRHGVFTLMAKEAVRCSTLKGVYQHIVRFYTLVNGSFTLSMTEHGDDIQFNMKLIEPEKDHDGLLLEFLMLLWHRFPSWLIGQRIPLKEIHFSHAPPQHVDEYALMYPCPAKFNQDTNGFVFSKEWLDAPVIQRLRTLKTHLRRAPLDWFTKQAFFAVYTRRVLDQLEKAEDFSHVSMEEVAQQLHMTERTLRRKLTQEDTSFQTIKDAMRRDMAIHLLSQPSIPISQVSLKLGFSEPTAFTRAFRQWTGSSPKTFRDTIKV